jgi:hypothetical protein
MVLFNMQQNKGKGFDTSSTAVCHEAVTSIIGILLIILMSKAYKGVFPHTNPTDIPGLK